jgi:hypothetical protein
MSKLPIPADDLVPPSVRKSWELKYENLTSQLRQLEILLKASGGLPKQGGDKPTPPPPASPPRGRPAKRSGRKTKRAQRGRRVARKRGVPASPMEAQPSAEEAPHPPETPVPQTVDRKPVKGRHKEGTWTRTILDIVAPTIHPMAYSDLKSEILRTSFGDRLRQGDKAFYTGIDKLHGEGLIVRYKGHAFSPAGFKKFEADLAAGMVRDLHFANPSHESPMGEAITAMMKNRPRGAQSGNIVWELRKNPDFAAALEKNPTHLYNVLKRLVSKGILRKTPGTKRYFYIAVKDEAPSDTRPEGAPQNPSEGGSSVGVG